MIATGEHAVIAGVGQTEYSRASGRGVLRLAVEAIVAACRDAGIEPSEIDGFVGYQHGITAEDLVSTLRIEDLRTSCTLHIGGASAVASLHHAALAVLSGTARNVVVVRAANNASGARIHERPSHLSARHYRQQFEDPQGWNTAAQRYALICRRYMFEHDLRREQLGAFAVTLRQHANLNPNAQMHDRPLTMDDYLAGRVIADPYTLYDCCLETDGACAVIIGARPSAPRREADAEILAVAEGRPERPDDLTNRANLLDIGLRRAAQRLWDAVDLAPGDMDAAMIYDPFTFQALHQLEAAGFVEAGGAGAFVEAGHVALGGRLPVNTHGGLLSEGHLAGLNHVIEATRQLRGACGARQVAGARHVAVTGWGDLGDGSIAVLRRTSR